MDLWSVDQTKAAFLGITAHWIDSGKESCSSNWTLHTEVIAFRGISGMHTGENIGRYFVSLAERVGIITQSSSKVRFNILGIETLIADFSLALLCHGRQHQQ